MNIPAAGDIVWVDFDPVRGNGQAGRRPALVLTDSDYNAHSARTVVCPITGNVAPWPTKIVLPSSMKTKGAVLSDQPRSVHRETRGFRFIEAAPPEVRLAVLAILRELLGMEFD